MISSFIQLLHVCFTCLQSIAETVDGILFLWHNESIFCSSLLNKYTCVHVMYFRLCPEFLLYTTNTWLTMIDRESWLNELVGTFDLSSWIGFVFHYITTKGQDAPFKDKTRYSSSI